MNLSIIVINFSGKEKRNGISRRNIKIFKTKINSIGHNQNDNFGAA